MSMTIADMFHRLVYDIDADDVARELEPVHVGRRQEIWEKALEQLGSDKKMRHRLLYLVQVLGALSKDYETPLRRKTKEALKAIENPLENDRRSIQRILAQIEHREAKMMTFARYEALARLVKYGNMYKTREDRGDMQFWRARVEGEAQFGVSNDETVEWLVSQGLADHGDYDPAFCLGKVTPSVKAPQRLENHGLTAESSGVGVHIGHCCLKVHGCKYSDEFCPVTTKMFPPDSEQCGFCYEDDAMWDDTVEGIPSNILANELESRGYTVTDPDEDGADAEG